MITALILAAAMTSILSIMAILGFSEMKRMAKADPSHTQHD